MAGGTFTSYDKIRPGAYLNFKSVSQKEDMIGSRGIGAICLPLSWGKQGALIEVLSEDLLGDSLKSIGLTSNDSEAKLLVGMLSYCYKALVFNGNTGGAKASAVIGDLEVTARYNGAFGNNISVAILAVDGSSLFDVITYVNGTSADIQTVSNIDSLEDNDYVVFAGTGDLEANAGTALEDGEDGTYMEATAYDSMMDLLKVSQWQTLAVPSVDPTVLLTTKAFIKEMREKEGRYVQCVVANDDTADYEGIINNVCGVVINGIEFTTNETTAIVAGMTAGADVNESNTARKIEGSEKIIGELSNSEIEKGLKKGQFIISTSRNGEIRVEKDINSLHTFTKEKKYPFSKNRVIRALDQIGTDTVNTWEQSYMGKMDNDEDGRASFKSDLIAYGNEADRKHIIQNFVGSEDVKVRQGTDIESVIADWIVQPVDSMEKLYMTVHVNA